MPLNVLPRRVPLLDVMVPTFFSMPRIAAEREARIHRDRWRSPSS